MIQQMVGFKVMVPDLAIEGLTKHFTELKVAESWEDLRAIRESAFEVIEFLVHDRELLSNEEYQLDLVSALAIRNALANIQMLYDC